MKFKPKINRRKLLYGSIKIIIVFFIVFYLFSSPSSIEKEFNNWSYCHKVVTMYNEIITQKGFIADCVMLDSETGQEYYELAVGKQKNYLFYKGYSEKIQFTADSKQDIIEAMDDIGKSVVYYERMFSKYYHGVQYIGGIAPADCVELYVDSKSATTKKQTIKLNGEYIEMVFWYIVADINAGGNHYYIDEAGQTHIFDLNLLIVDE